MPKIVRNEIEYSSTTSTANQINYLNTTSGLSATNVQGAIDELKNLITYVDYKVPAYSFSSGTIGGIETIGTVDITKSGYTPISANITIFNHPGAGHITPLITNSTTLTLWLYRATSNAINNPAGDAMVRVAYIKS